MPVKNTNNLTGRFKAFFKENNLSDPSLRFLVAVSGGLDSMVLCELCKQSGLQFSIAHCNFQLRGEESERDEAFVRSAAEKFAVEFFVRKLDTVSFSEKSRLSIQEAARKLRYAWFSELKEKNRFHHILVAHHANDSIETLVMNFFRGTGLEGMTGINQHNISASVLRPMLSFTREAIEAFASANGIKWMEDSSNSTSKYTRNLFRNEILPQVRQVYPRVDENLLNTIERFKKINALYRLSVEDLKSVLLQRTGNELRLPAKKLLQYRNTSIVYEVIRDFGFGEKQVEDVLHLAEAETGKFISNENYQIIKHRLWLIIAPVVSSTDFYLIQEDQQQVKFAGGELFIRMQKNEKTVINKSEHIAQLDADTIVFPLLLRKWKTADYFYPLGMRKKKKLSRFFIDHKIPKNRKESIWVLESDKKIIWIAGLRIDDRFRITPQTKTVLEITYQDKLLTG